MVKKICLFLAVTVLFFGNLVPAFAASGKAGLIREGHLLFLRSGCLRCHTLQKKQSVRGYDTLYGFGGRGLTIKETERAIRSCKMDKYCSDILTNKQVREIAYYLNSLKPDYSSAKK